MIKQGMFILMDETLNRPAYKGQSVVSFRGEYATLLYGDAPHKPDSTGRVAVRNAAGRVETFFPSVFDLKWMRA